MTCNELMEKITLAKTGKKLAYRVNLYISNLIFILHDMLIRWIRVDAPDKVYLKDQFGVLIKFCLCIVDNNINYFKYHLG